MTLLKEDNEKLLNNVIIISREIEKKINKIFKEINIEIIKKLRN
jgi:hypothetical protein